MRAILAFLLLVLLFSTTPAAARADAFTAARQWVDDPAVWAVGEGVDAAGNPVIRVYASGQANLPESLNGLPVVVVESGEIRALDADAPRPGFRDVYRPTVPGGSSVGPLSSGGTLTGWFWEPRRGRYVAVSNNHVFCRLYRLPPGTPLFQPGWVDVPDYERLYQDYLFARLEYCAPLPAQDDNLADSAYAYPLDAYWTLEMHTAEGLRPRPSAIREPRPGDTVCKSGRTTGWSCARVEVVRAAVNVTYGPYEMRSFLDQVVTTKMSEPGDSGSLVVTEDMTALSGQLFAGNASITVYSPMTHVLNALGLLPGCPGAPGSLSQDYPAPQDAYPAPREPAAQGLERLHFPGVLSSYMMLTSGHCIMP